jgi:hypothetical protein
MTTFALLATAIGDRLIKAGQIINTRYSFSPDPETEETRLWARSERWRAHVQQFAFFADIDRFSQRRMLRSGLCTREAWNTYTHLLVQAGVIVKIPRSGCYWCDTWNRHKLGALLRVRAITLPYPIGQDPPPLFHTRQSVTQTAQRRQTPQLSSIAWSRQ